MADQTARLDAGGKRETERETLQSHGAQAFSRQMERESRRYPMKFTQ